MTLRYDLSWLTTEDALDLIDALSCAVEFEEDRLDYAREYPGEYDDDDIAHMRRKMSAFNALYARIAGSSYRTTGGNNAKA